MMIIEFISAIVIFSTLWGLLPRNEWWVRCFDFPRLQILAVGVLVWVALIYAIYQNEMLQNDSFQSFNFKNPPLHDVLLLILLTGSILYQSWMILPYTLFWRKQVIQAESPDPMNMISLLVSNVLTPNNNYQALIDHVRHYQPDVLVTLETDSRWERALSVIEVDYPYVVRVPLDNMYGIHLYSRLPLVNPEVKFLFSREIPSIHTQVRLRSGKLLRLYCLHPKPPTPNEAWDSTLRDAELLAVGDHVAHQRQSCIVAGDLNDVAWSRTTRLFQRISGLLDPRVGRQFMNTFHVNYLLLRWSLDHVFHTSDFSLVNMKLLESIGSDHFPVYTVLHHDPKVQLIHRAPIASQEDTLRAMAKINAGIVQARAEMPGYQSDEMIAER
ncbi:MAG: endonuclease/exonuclease/phosphatase family protein [Candidatus Saccharibacteria bacterium]|nr:endonuclease/exonuclease/phosphatase family protein [Moraxellaceae bacterium]